MKAQVIRTFGDPDVFKIEDIPKPEIEPGHLLIKVHASSVNQVDCKIRRGEAPSIAPEFPAVLHSDVAGTVEEVGEGVKDFQVGDEVYGCAGGMRGCEGGALAEYLLADAHLIAKKPKSLSFGEAAALPLVTLTSWIALFSKGSLTTNMNILIHGGLGGVGHIAVQLAKWKGAKIYTTVGSDASFDQVRELGADFVINYKSQNVGEYVARFTETKGFDFVFDTVGGKNLDNSFEAAALNGRVATTQARSMHDLTPLHQKGLSFHVVFMLIPLIYGVERKGHGEILTKAADLVDQGKLKPLLCEEQFSLDQVSAAHALMESGKARGKIILNY